MAGSLPLLPHLLIVSGETRRSSATSRTVRRSGKSSILRFLLVDFVAIFDCFRLFEILLCVNTVSPKHNISKGNNLCQWSISPLAGQEAGFLISFLPAQASADRLIIE